MKSYNERDEEEEAQHQVIDTHLPCWRGLKVELQEEYQKENQGHHQNPNEKYQKKREPRRRQTHMTPHGNHRKSPQPASASLQHYMEKTDSEFCTQEQQEAKEIRFEPMTLELTKEATAEQGNVTHAQTKGRAAQCNQDHGMRQTSARGNRFVTVIQYALDMVLAIREMARVARPEAHLILVLGRESTVRHVPFFNGKLVSELAVRRIGLENERRQERQFVNHYGNKIHEDILHFRTSSNIPDKGFCLAAAPCYRGSNPLSNPLVNRHRYPSGH